MIEPLLPSDPTELELGRNLYWHWCMTCHGDSGQGLTDEFRSVWPEDHQNCWARGCHTGRPGELGFPIPTIVPAIVDEAHLSQFSSLQEFADFLQSTHPPQSPGVLKDEEYHAIALFVFTMNGRLDATLPPPTIPASTPTATLLSPTVLKSGPNFTLIGAITGLVALVVMVLGLLGKFRIQEKHFSGPES